MEEIIVNGIAAGGQDYKEADKLIKIITAERGVLTALMKGVKKDKAKLKFAAMPFSFCQYSLLRRGDFYTVKTASSVENLFDITYDPDKYIAGSLMLETAAAAIGAQPTPEIFIFLLNGIKRLLCGDVDAYSVALNFVFGSLTSGGHYAAKPSDDAYAGDISKQESMPRETAIVKLKSFSELFEHKYSCRIKSLKFI